MMRRLLLLLALLPVAGCANFDDEAMEKMAAQEPLDPSAFETSIREVDRQVFAAGDLDPARRMSM